MCKLQGHGGCEGPAERHGSRGHGSPERSVHGVLFPSIPPPCTPAHASGNMLKILAGRLTVTRYRLLTTFSLGNTCSERGQMRATWQTFWVWLPAGSERRSHARGKGLHGSH